MGSVNISCTTKACLVLTICNHLSSMPIVGSMPVNRDPRGLEVWWVLEQSGTHRYPWID